MTLKSFSSDTRRRPRSRSCSPVPAFPLRILLSPPFHLLPLRARPPTRTLCTATATPLSTAEASPRTSSRALACTSSTRATIPASARGALMLEVCAVRALCSTRSCSGGPRASSPRPRSPRIRFDSTSFTIRYALGRILWLPAELLTPGVHVPQLGVRTFIGSIGPVQNVRMMVRVLSLVSICAQAVRLIIRHRIDEIWAPCMLHVARLCPAALFHSQRCQSRLLWLLGNHQPGHLAHQGTSVITRYRASHSLTRRTLARWGKRR